MSSPATTADTYNRASRVNRLLAFSIDMAVVVFILLLKYVLVWVGMRFYDVLGPMLLQVVHSGLTLLAFGYFLFCDALPKGQSLGKRLCRIAVVGFPYPTICTIPQSFLRNACKLLFSPLDGFLVLFGLRRRLGDMLAKTIVVKA
ncbi:RDD family protein [Pseudomonas fluorescens]|nr:RDD family protein [Pseudomonas fluorescens]OPB15240.1 RDD family protein [Pseudomonas fluorescens]OPB28608.1 RDD family protein [Pseudomonas fluorescens]